MNHYSEEGAPPPKKQKTDSNENINSHKFARKLNLWHPGPTGIESVSPLKPPSPHEATVYSNAPNLLVELQCDKGVYSFVVSATALRIASPVWNKLLDPFSHFKALDTKKIGERILPISRLEDIDPAVLNLFYKIIHYQTRAIDGPVRLEELFHFAIMADQFDCMGVLARWVERWIRFLVGEAGYIPDQHNLDVWIFISSIFQNRPSGRKVFEKVTTSFTRRMIEPGTSGLIPISGFGANWHQFEEIKREYIPDNVFYHAINTREKICAQSLKMVTDFVATLQEISIDRRKRQEWKLCSNNGCIDLAYGSLMRSLCTKSISPSIPDNTGYSIESLVQTIQSLDLATFCYGYKRDNERSEHMAYSQPSNEACSFSSLLAPVVYTNFVRNNPMMDVCPIAVRFVALQDSVRAHHSTVGGFDKEQAQGEKEELKTNPL